jgi:T-complex protein 1 subunit theta
VRGVVIQRDADSAIKHVAKAKIAVFGCSIEASSPETKGVVVIKNADELKAYNKGEEKMMEEMVKGIADSGAKVVVSGGSISEIALHFIQKFGLLAVRIPSKFELRRLCKAVGASAMVAVGPPPAAVLGYCDSVSVQELSSRLVTVFRQDAGEDSGISTIVLRGATMNMMDDMERAIDDAANVAGLEAYAFHKFAEALECVPRTLAENSGQNATHIVAALYAAHQAGKGSVGVDVDGEGSKDAVAAGILDSLAVKSSAIKLAAETAITVLRVDQIIMSKQVRRGERARAHRRLHCTH